MKQWCALYVFLYSYDGSGMKLTPHGVKELLFFIGKVACLWRYSNGTIFQLME